MRVLLIQVQAQLALDRFSFTNIPFSFQICGWNINSAMWVQVQLALGCFVSLTWCVLQRVRDCICNLCKFTLHFVFYFHSAWFSAWKTTLHLLNYSVVFYRSVSFCAFMNALPKLLLLQPFLADLSCFRCWMLCLSAGLLNLFSAAM